VNKLELELRTKVTVFPSDRYSVTFRGLYFQEWNWLFTCCW